jgi:hypothetical protein
MDTRLQCGSSRMRTILPMPWWRIMEERDCRKHPPPPIAPRYRGMDGCAVDDLSANRAHCRPVSGAGSAAHVTNGTHSGWGTLGTPPRCGEKSSPTVLCILGRPCSWAAPPPFAKGLQPIGRHWWLSSQPTERPSTWRNRGSSRKNPRACGSANRCRRGTSPEEKSQQR